MGGEEKITGKSRDEKNIEMKKLIFWQNSKWDKSQKVTYLSYKIVINLKNPNCDKTQNLIAAKKMWQYTKTQIVTKLKNSIVDKIQEIKLWQNLTN